MESNGNSDNPTGPINRVSSYQFGSYTLDATQKALFCDGLQIRIPLKTYELLLYLAQNKNRIIEKSELLREVWGDSFVEESNISVHVSNLRKIITADPAVNIETLPKIGYRFAVNNHEEKKIGGDNGFSEIVSPKVAVPVSEQIKAIPLKQDRLKYFISVIRQHWVFALLALVVGGAVIVMLNYSWSGKSGLAMGEGSNVSGRKSAFTWIREECPRDSLTTNLEVGGCDDAVKSFSLNSNPNGNWAYGYSPKDDFSRFFLFEKANHNNHYASPEVPADYWTRPNEWHPLVLKNTSNVVYVSQGAVVVPPSMFEVHPGAKGERSVVRWIAPATGHYRIQGQFRGINGSGYTTTDVAVIENGSAVRFSADVEGFNFEHPFDVTFKLSAGDTVDFSVGYGSNGKYEGDSTGFSAIVTTLSLERTAPASSP
ncbi:MAG TPA: winged helix-turn-helix domain-containing protein [Pyrinomonadaceae bacterium]|nr:winged helix-turn-helix domain-containing protein [Pyrinomonadaceae bacterium]